jgi:anti-sigma factor RsiW
LNCDDVRNALLEDPLSETSSAQIQTHLRTCAACRAEGALYVEMEKALRSMPPWEPPKGFASRIAVFVSNPAISQPEAQAFLQVPVVAIGAVFLGLIIAFNAEQAGGSYEGFVRGFLTLLQADPHLTAWASAALSLWFSLRYTMRMLR